MKGFWRAIRPTVLGSLCVLIAVVIVLGFVWLLAMLPMVFAPLLLLGLVIFMGRLIGKELFGEED